MVTISGEGCHSLFDLVCNLYATFHSAVTNEDYFISKYINQEMESNQLNPRDKAIVQMLPVEIMRIAEETVCVAIARNLIQFVAKTNELLMKKRFETCLEATIKEQILLLCIINGIDLAIEAHYKHPQCLSPFSMGPLNDNHHQNEIGVYLKYLPHSHVSSTSINEKRVDTLFEMRSLIDEGYGNPSGKSKPYLRNVEPLSGLMRMLSILLFIRKDMLEVSFSSPAAGFPKAVIIDLEDEDISRLDKEKKISVAMSPVTCEPFFNFSEGLIRYSEDHLNLLKKKYTAILKKMRELSPDFILFPEYSFPEGMEKVFSYKNEIPPKETFCIFAGSARTTDDNNVMTIFSHSGKVLGRYFKYSPYINNSGFRESLQHPGKEITLLYVRDSIGYVLPSICKDVLKEPTYKLSILFSPLLLFIASYSPSLSPFKDFAKRFAADSHTSVLFCNSCTATTIKRKHVGFASVPCTEEGEESCCASADIHDITRKADCPITCSRKGCIYFVTFTFTLERLLAKKSIEWEMIPVDL